MRSLFVKIFSSFILIIVLVAAAVVVLTYFRDQEFPPLAQQSFARQALAEYGRKAINTYEKRGEGGVDAFSRQIFNRSGIRLLLFDRAGIPLTHKRVPPLLQRLVQRALRSGEVVLPRRGPRNGLAGKVVGSSGESYFIAIRLPGHPPPPRLLEGITRGFLGWHLLLLLTVTATICFILARSLTAPISRLRRATREFAGGDLSVRIGTQVKGKNELVGLAHDFDEMAGKIEGLVDAQKILLRDISHELRSPLARLRIALELARQQESSATQQKSLNRIELEAERMNSMIGQLLDLTRLESGSIERPRQKINLSELLATVIADANFEAKTCGCQVVYNGPDQVDYSAIPDLLLRALENVIRNAVKYTADNSVVSVDLSESAAEVKIVIADQGEGVPAEALDKLFDPFYRVADARDRNSGGTGIGLAIAQRAIKFHGGTIRARNQSSAGLAVEIILPVC